MNQTHDTGAHNNIGKMDPIQSIEAIWWWIFCSCYAGAGLTDEQFKFRGKGLDNCKDWRTALNSGHYFGCP
ncbi:MAG: hypothetical protein PHI40_02925 [Caldisericia bacterium]|nr:hypothetical protein [Caldisericia bacterium]MDD4614345.1 hypothetical protein [Caldisericia bacterium]